MHIVILQTMKTKIKYWSIFNYRLKELTDNVETRNANPNGSSRAMIILLPLLILTVLIEYLWIKIFGGDPGKYA